MVKRLFAMAVLGVAGLFLAMPDAVAAPDPLRNVTAHGRRNVYLAEAARLHGATITRKAGQVIVSRGADRMIFYPDKRYAHHNNVKINLCHAAFLQDNQPMLSRSDYDTVFAPLFGSRLPIKHTIGTIVLDPGHGGNDQGAAGKQLLEKNITLNLTNRVAKILQAYGYRVILTRNRDTTLSLDERGAFANRNRADVFVSIHVNSAENKTVTGIESFCMTPVGVGSSNGGSVDAKSYPGNVRDRNNFLLSYHLQRSMLNQTQGVDRGVKFARWAVLRNVNCPASLIEVGFLSNPAEEARLANSAHLDKLARGIAAGILSYHRSLSR